MLDRRISIDCYDDSNDGGGDGKCVCMYVYVKGGVCMYVHTQQPWFALTLAAVVKWHAARLVGSLAQTHYRNTSLHST